MRRCARGVRAAHARRLLITVVIDKLFPTICRMGRGTAAKADKRLKNVRMAYGFRRLGWERRPLPPPDPCRPTSGGHVIQSVEGGMDSARKPKTCPRGTLRSWGACDVSRGNRPERSKPLAGRSSAAMSILFKAPLRNVQYPGACPSLPLFSSTGPAAEETAPAARKPEGRET